MATKYHYFSGTGMWMHRLRQPDEKYNNYTMKFYADKDTRKAIKDAGVQSKWDEDEGGFHITLRRPHEKLIKDEKVVFGPPKVLLMDKDSGKPVDYQGGIGNGSKVTVKLSVYDAGNAKGSRLEAVRIDDLVEYEQQDAEALPF